MQTYFNASSSNYTRSAYDKHVEGKKARRNILSSDWLNELKEILAEKKRVKNLSPKCTVD